MAKSEYEGVAFASLLSPDGLVVNVTNRAENSVTAYANLMEAVVVMKGDGFMPFERSYNKAQDNIVSAPSIIPDDADPFAGEDPFPAPESVVDAAKNLGGVESDPFADQYPPTLELVDFFKKAGEWKTGDVQECMVDQYRLGGGKIEFYRTDNEYPIHTHYLNDIGVKVMAQCFGDSWDKAFAPVTVPTAIPGGAFIIAVKGGAVRTTGQGAGNVFRNLSGARRP